MKNIDHSIRAKNTIEKITGMSSLTPSRVATVAVVASCGGAFAIYAVSLSAEKAPWPWWMQLPIQGAGMIALTAGTTMLLRGPHLNRIGSLLIVFGVTWYVGDLQFSEQEILYAVGFCLFFINHAVMAHIVLSFPSGHLRDPITSAVVVSLYAVILVTQTVRYFVEYPPQPQVWGDPNAETYSPWATVGTVAGLTFCMIVFFLVVRRWRSERPPTRRGTAPVWSTAILTAVLIVGFLIVALTHASAEMNHLLLFGYATAVLLVPIAGQIGSLREWIGRANAFERLAQFEQTSSESWRDLLARWLGDPAIRIYPWLPEEGGYANPDGGTIDFPVDPSREVTPLEWNGRPLGILIHDSSLTGARQLKSVANVTRIVLEKEALQARLRRSLNLLVDLEIEHLKALQSALHDGGQDEVIGIKLAFGNLADKLGETPETELRTLAQEGVSMAEKLQIQIKEVAFELYPVALRFGLREGVKSLYDKLQLPLRNLAVPEDRFPKRIEHAAYRVISEAVRNARTHADADNIWVTVTHQHDRLVVEIVDDGVGGADSPGLWGVGSQRARELVIALGGSFDIESPRGTGTRVRAELSCTS